MIIYMEIYMELHVQVKNILLECIGMNKIALITPIEELLHVCKRYIEEEFVKTCQRLIYDY